MIGIYVHQTRAIPYADAIIEGYKTIETRTTDTLGKFVGQRILLIRTRSGHPSEVIGAVDIVGKQHYSAGALDTMRDKTLIPPGSKFDCHGRGKWGYTLSNPEKFEEPTALANLDVIRKTRTYAEINLEEESRK